MISNQQGTIKKAGKADKTLLDRSGEAQPLREGKVFSYPQKTLLFPFKQS